MFPRPSADKLLASLRSRSPYKERDAYYCDDDEWEWRLDGEPLGGALRNNMFDWIDKHLRTRLECPFCDSPLAIEAVYEHYDNFDRSCILDTDEPPTDEYMHGTLAVCLRCWYWHWYASCTLGLVGGWDAAVAKMRSFDRNAPPDCMQELAAHLRQDPNRWNTLDPKKLESIVAEIWRHNYDYADVIHVGKPADGGVDVLFVDSRNGQWLIQVKRRSNPRIGEGVGVLRNLLGAMHLHQSSLGIVVSTADHFTHHARAAASKAKSLGATLELVDRGRLDRMLEGYHPPFPWMRYIDETRPHLSDYFSRKGFGL
jgi:hypothetical protein